MDSKIRHERLSLEWTRITFKECGMIQIYHAAAHLNVLELSRGFVTIHSALPFGLLKFASLNVLVLLKMRIS